MKNYIIFDNVDSRNFDVPVFFGNIDGIPKREVDEYSIAGRNGSLIIDKGKFLNIDHSYFLVSYGDNHRKINDFLNELARHVGFYRLSDSFRPDEFYSAMIADNLSVTTWLHRDSSKVELVFTRDPRRFLFSGVEPVEFTENGVISNPTMFASNPLITVNGSGTLTIGDQTILVSDAFSETVIDSEMMDCYSGEHNANSAVTLSGNNFPVLTAGENEIGMTGSITKVEIVPRWWRL